MPNYSARIPIRSFRPPGMRRHVVNGAKVEKIEPFRLLSADWSKIEAAYGRKLTAQFRVEIEEVTDWYIFAAHLEDRKAYPAIADAVLRLKSLRKMAQTLCRLINKGPDEIKKYIDFQMSTQNGPNQSRTSGALNLHSKELARFIQSCDAALLLMKKDSQSQFWQPGAALDNWLWLLAECAKRYGLPVKVSKHKPNEGAPFAHFVWELQNKIPKKFRSDQSIGALSGAISKAKKSLRRQHGKGRVKVSPPRRPRKSARA